MFVVISFSSGADDPRSVVITGIGLVTPLGTDCSSSWMALKAGRRAVRELVPDEIDYRDELSKLSHLKLYGAPADHVQVLQKFDAICWPAHIPGDVVRAWRSEPVIAMSLVALSEAMHQSRLGLGESLSPGQRKPRIGCLFGASKGGLRSFERLVGAMLPGSTGRLALSDDEFAAGWNWAQTDGATRALSMAMGVDAVMSCPVAACATGLVSLLQAGLAIRSGQCDLCIAGSSDAALRATVLSSFHRLRVLSRHAEAASACRPFDETRDGFAIGEGAGVFVLETRESAEQRGVRPLARLVAGRWVSDPTGMTQIDASGSVVSRLIEATLRTAGDSIRIGYANLHGTGTETNDLAEARGLTSAMQRAESQLSEFHCSGFKGQIGHLLGGASSVECGLSLLAMRDRTLPATINLEQLDPRIEIPLLKSSQQLSRHTAMLKLALGFGGHVACGVFDTDENH